MPKKRPNTNKVLIPEWLCHRFNLHKWVWPTHNRAILAGTCRRCGMNGVTFWDRLKRENKRHKKV